MEADEFVFKKNPVQAITAEFADETLAYYTLRVAGILNGNEPEPPDDTVGELLDDMHDSIWILQRNRDLTNDDGADFF